MTLLGNTFFWTFFFMIGFIASLEILEDVGPQFAERIFKHKIDAIWLIVGYVILIILFIRLLRLFGTTYTWTANALRNGALIYISTKLDHPKGLQVLLGATFLSFWPYWHFNIWSALGFAGTLGLLLLLQYWRHWIHQKNWHLCLTLVVTSVIFWSFDMLSYGYALDETIGVTSCFIVVMLLAHSYDHLLRYRKQQTHELVYDTQHDALTGSRSLKKFTSDFSRYHHLSLKGQVPAVHLVMIDIDHFKQINDTYGHLIGNDVLQAFVQNCEGYLDTIPFPCTLYRTGGEEFSIIIAGGATEREAQQIIAGYRMQLKQFFVKTPTQNIQITVSAGITKITAKDAENKAVIARADANLYQAKRAGRNRVVTDTETS
ncbi:GGDEF domain-containing protein [Loigolactobacillus bifermentans]|uniref:Signal transduction diguanylate cyclase n=1 Tax=Loigolactobacillus bifermentans DSM 20003 TaxID=1423726 RepID=A0A0R1H193_9LACO|nr:GGDEF domain-containing protein [Loigolactobacillus bifermentans]KRK39785.1 Signal transduction diguanylate cyclase [Loigolactobacillus bifermentans DSM 20003]QGG60964.1 diguanylate cyclase [Loigolactobacillus bifermentans]